MPREQLTPGLHRAHGPVDDRKLLYVVMSRFSKTHQYKVIAQLTPSLHSVRVFILKHHQDR